jgi:hypothetical protein
VKNGNDEFAIDGEDGSTIDGEDKSSARLVVKANPPFQYKR